MNTSQELRSRDFYRIVISGAVLELEVGNLVTETTDAIVNPAQATLAPGGGVDGEIHLWGGPRIWEACQHLGGCEIGNAKITTGGDLKVRYVIHTVGPIWSGGHAGEAEALASCYRRCLEVAQENCVESIAFPAISTGHYGYPMEAAAEIALRTVSDCLSTNEAFQLVRFVLKGKEAFVLYSLALEQVFKEEAKNEKGVL